MTIETVIEEIVAKAQCLSRVKLHEATTPSDWASWLITPTLGYIELSSCGPIAIREVEWIEINPVTIVSAGRLIKGRTIDHRQEIENILFSTGIPFQLTAGFIRIYFN